jgi:hypothetical protein
MSAWERPGALMSCLAFFCLAGGSMPATPYAAFEAEARAQGHDGGLKPNAVSCATAAVDLGRFALQARSAIKG